MVSVPNQQDTSETLSHLLNRLGNIGPHRIRLAAAPGFATESDVLRVHERDGRLCELVDGVLVEKEMGFRESLLAVALIKALDDFAEQRNLGLVTAPDGMMRLAPGLVRIPDVAFLSWERLPDRRVPDTPIPALVPDLAVEVQSSGNTPQEMARKCREYFEAGVILVWLVNHENRTVTVHTNTGESMVLGAGEELSGEPVLPGFRIALTDLFAGLDRQGASER